MVTSLQDRTAPGEGATLAFGCSHGAGLIFLSPAVGSFKANRFEVVSRKAPNVTSNRAPLSQPGLPFPSVQDGVRLRAPNADSQAGGRCQGDERMGPVSLAAQTPAGAESRSPV